MGERLDRGTNRLGTTPCSQKYSCAGTAYLDVCDVTFVWVKIKDAFRVRKKCIRVLYPMECYVQLCWHTRVVAVTVAVTSHVRARWGATPRRWHSSSWRAVAVHAGGTPALAEASRQVWAPRLAVGGSQRSCGRGGVLGAETRIAFLARAPHRRGIGTRLGVSRGTNRLGGLPQRT